MVTNFINGKIYVDSNTFVEAFSVEDGKIKSVGKTDDIKNISSDETVDLGGKTVIPGLNDSHLHLYHTGNTFYQANLVGSQSIEEVIERGKKYLKDAGDDCKFIYGQGWNQDFFTTGEKRLLTKDDLDQISTEIPIIFVRVCVHVATANSKALEILGVTEDTVIDGGEILKDENGELNGIFTENALAYLYSIIPEETKDEIEEKILKAANYAIKNGLTSVQTCDIMANNYKVFFPIIENIYKENKTKLRYSPQFNFQNIDDLYDYIDNYYSKDVYDEYFQRGCLKLFKDGSLGARTASLRNPYNDDPSTSGVTALSNKQIDAFCTYAKEKNIRVIIHAIGDLAIEEVVNSYLKIIDKENKLRHGIVHCQITDLPLLEKIAEYNIPVMYQPIFLDYDITMIEDRVGKKLAETSYAFNTLYKLGAPTSHGTDCPVEDLNPFANMYCAVNRKRLKEPNSESYYPKEKMSIEDVIDNYTIGSAYNEGTENYKGRIKENYVADFIVLDRDIFTIPSEEIKDVTVDQTFINGELVYSK